MANHKSAKNRIVRNSKRNVINGARRNRVRTFVKKVEAKNTNLCPFLLDRVVRICVFLCGKPRNPRDSVKTLCQDN